MEILISAWVIIYAIVVADICMQDTPYKPNDMKTQLWVNCSFCGQFGLTQIFDFGKTALAGGFLKPEYFDRETKYPTRVCFCRKCFSLQMVDRVSPDEMFRKYFYFSSSTETIKNHFRDYAEEIYDRFRPETAIEIGCNDGVFLIPLREKGVRVFGVDPSSASIGGEDVVNDYFTETVARRLGQVDLVVANNVFAHIGDVHGATRAVSSALKPGGVFIMEVHYIGDMLRDVQYDWIYHEHLYYYSLLSAEKHFSNYGLRIFDVKRVPTHGGSIRFFMCRDDRLEADGVGLLRKEEHERGLDREEVFIDFASKVEAHRKDLYDKINGLSGIVAGYGASGRASALLQYCGIKLDYIVDDAPAKWGYFTPGSHIPIVSADELSNKPPDHLVILAWPYAKEIQSKIDIPAIVPLPKIQELND
jgi:methylation protein EvaC